MKEISWYKNDSVAEAAESAAASRKSLLVDFWSPTCKGCAKMFATTYQDAGVKDFLANTFVCVKFNTAAPNEWFRRLNGSFAHLWHPDIVVLDSRLTEVRRFIGYLTPRDFIAQLTIGAGLAALYHQEGSRALTLFERVVDEYSTSAAAAEALYWAGVAAYRAGGGIEALTPRWEAIHAKYPSSEWSIRADCLDLDIPDRGFLDTDLSTVRFTQPSIAR